MPGPERQTRCSAFSFMPSTELWRPVLWGQLSASGPRRTAGQGGGQMWEVRACWPEPSHHHSGLLHL